jgi:hypothetical protein
MTGLKIAIGLSPKLTTVASKTLFLNLFTEEHMEEGPI